MSHVSRDSHTHFLITLGHFKTSRTGNLATSGCCITHATHHTACESNTHNCTDMGSTLHNSLWIKALRIAHNHMVCRLQVAATFGFQLSVVGPLKSEHSGTAAEAHTGLETLAPDAAHEDSSGPSPSKPLSARPLQRLDVGLQLARLNHSGGEGVSQALMSSAAAEQSAQTARVLTRIAPVSTLQQADPSLRLLPS